MEKINIAELLRDCPQGMELYSPIFGKVYLDKVRRYLAIIVTTDRKQGDSKEEFLYDGRYGMNGECMLFPSKGKTTWEGFVPPCQFKDGDVIVVSGAIVLFKQVHSLYEEPHVDFYCGFISKHKTFILKTINSQHCGKISSSRYATEEEKAELFDAIKTNGYKWNTRTKTLYKLIEPKFKVGDRIKNGKDIATIVGIYEDFYDVKIDSRIGSFTIDLQDEWELLPNKFDINTLKPFDKVLVREDNKKLWRIHFFERLNNVLKDRFVCMGGYRYNQCVPYEGNEHLLNTNNEPDDFFKTL